MTVAASRIPRTVTADGVALLPRTRRAWATDRCWKKAMRISANMSSLVDVSTSTPNAGLRP